MVFVKKEEEAFPLSLSFHDVRCVVVKTPTAVCSRASWCVCVCVCVIVSECGSPCRSPLSLRCSPDEKG